MSDFNFVAAAAGGALIGAAAVLLFVANGRIAGVSGISAGLFARVNADTLWRAAFILGLFAGGALYIATTRRPLEIELSATVPVTALAGLLVGFGTRLGSGCTSGHGVCGIARFSARSLLATVTFIVSAMMTVFVLRHVLA